MKDFNPEMKKSISILSDLAWGIGIHTVAGYEEVTDIKDAKCHTLFFAFKGGATLEFVEDKDKDVGEGESKGVKIYWVFFLQGKLIEKLLPLRIENETDVIHVCSKLDKFFFPKS